MKFFVINNWMIVKQITVLFLIAIMCVQCSPSSKQPQKDDSYRWELTDKLYQSKNEDSLKLMLRQFREEGDELGALLCYKYLGLFLRENSRFMEAVNYHQDGLNLALKLRDTVEIVRAYNNLGTDFRRIGAQGEASDYHYQALTYAESYSLVNVPGAGMKNRAVSLNGVGNVSLALGYLVEAEKYFRMALKDESILKSQVGQAVNYANLGAIFEQSEQLDSAYVYYNKSLELNRIANSDLGVGLCLIHLGQFYEKKKEYRQAKEQYQQACKLLYRIVERWYWLDACISIARVNLLENNISEFDYYIGLGEETAHQIKSPGHLADIYLLKHDYEIKHANYREALSNYKLYTDMQDSVQVTQKSSRFIDARINYEQNKNNLKLQKIDTENRAEQEEKQRALYITWIVSMIGAIVTAFLYYAYLQRSRRNKILQHVEQTRSDFFTNITHEFKTPLTVIKGFNKLLSERRVLPDKEKMVYAVAIERQCDNLLNMVNQLLDISKLKSGVEAPVWKRGDIISYLRMTSETFKLYAEEKKVNLIFYSDQASQVMDFIPSYIDKIINNLLSNAIKHTFAGDEIDFTVMKGTHPDTIVIRVADTGEGIPREDLKRIFELFYQSKNGRNTSGTGIGLSFTQMLVGEMKGQIEVDSELGRGTLFTVTLPLTNKSLTNIEPLQAIPDVNPLKKPLFEILPDEEVDKMSDDGESLPSRSMILVVEDNKDVSTYIKVLLNDKYNVIVARNGQEGVEQAEEHIPDLVITDVMMPIMDGIQLCCYMKQRVMLNHIPIIMLTAKNSDEDRIKGLQCGAEAFIKKPFLPEELDVTIHNLLEGRKKLVEKYRDTLENTISSTTRIDSDANLKYLQTITDIIYAEIQNPELKSSFIADKMAVSVSQLNRKIKGITGHSTISYILQVKLGKAKKMLQNSSISVAEVADTCGFYDANYFSRVFKKEFGISPSQYQKMPAL